jgi:uncharacterized protein with HEPN domain
MYLSGVTFEGFIADNKTVDAVVRNLEIIGEAVKNLPDEIRALGPEVEWKKVARFRDIIVHHYFKIDYETVWDITQTKIDEIELVARRLLEIRSAVEDID